VQIRLRFEWLPGDWGDRVHAYVGGEFVGQFPDRSATGVLGGDVEGTAAARREVDVSGSNPVMELQRVSTRQARVPVSIRVISSSVG